MKNKVLNKVTKGAKKVGNFALNTGKVILATAVAIAATEVTFLGAEMAQNDAELVVKGVKHKIAPEPVYVRKGLKKEIKTINPITGQIEDYKGSKVPATKKAVKVK